MKHPSAHYLSRDCAIVAVVGLLILMLTACRDDNVRPGAVPEDVDAICRVECDVAVPRWVVEDPTDPASWDTYPEQVTIPLQGKARQCNLHRVACVQALDRLKAAGVTK